MNQVSATERDSRNFALTNGRHPVNYLMHPYSFAQLRDVTRLWVEWISYHRYEETSYRPLIQNVWLQQLFKMV